LPQLRIAVRIPLLYHHLRRLASVVGVLKEEDMLNAAFWSAIATGTLLIGIVLAYRNAVGPKRRS
jgi:hypothetical protein